VNLCYNKLVALTTESGKDLPLSDWSVCYKLNGTSKKLYGLRLGNISILSRQCNTTVWCAILSTAAISKVPQYLLCNIIEFFYNYQVITGLKHDIHTDIKPQTEALAATWAVVAHECSHLNTAWSIINPTLQHILLYTGHGNICNYRKGTWLQ